MATLVVVQDILWSPEKSRGGHSMCILHWLKAFERLGHRVIFINLFNYSGGKAPCSPAVLERFKRMIARWGKPENTALIDSHTGRSVSGLGKADLRRAVQHAAALITLGYEHPTEFTEKLRPRIYIDYDPGFTHIWATIKTPAEVFGTHDVYFTVGANVGTDRCELPTSGITWSPIWNPVVLDWWGAGGPITRNRFTTIADWWGWGYVEYKGQLLGPKAEQFRRFIDVPRRAHESPEIALAINRDSVDIALLERHGWILEDPAIVSEPDSYHDYVSGSAGEFSCATSVYVGTHCGWFSDRSSCYLAAGRPVVVQATGFEDVLPTGEGLFAVNSPEEAGDAIQAVRRDYAFHSAAARRLAEEYFDSDTIAAQLLKHAGI